jgi:hypothetical protein
VIPEVLLLKVGQNSLSVDWLWGRVEVPVHPGLERFKPLLIGGGGTRLLPSLSSGSQFLVFRFPFLYFFVYVFLRRRLWPGIQVRLPPGRIMHRSRFHMVFY